MIYLSCSETNWTSNLFPEAGFGDIFNLNGGSHGELWIVKWPLCLPLKRCKIVNGQMKYPLPSEFLSVEQLHSQQLDSKYSETFWLKHYSPKTLLSLLRTKQGRFIFFLFSETAGESRERKTHSLLKTNNFIWFKVKFYHEVTSEHFPNSFWNLTSLPWLSLE